MKGILSYQLVDPQLPNSEEGWFIEAENGAYKVSDLSIKKIVSGRYAVSEGSEVIFELEPNCKVSDQTKIQHAVVAKLHLEEENATKIFLIDIDGTICDDIKNEDSHLYPGAKVFPNSREVINKWYNEGNIITFFTAREAKDRRVTEEWLEANGFKYHGLVMDKPRIKDGQEYVWIDNRKVRAVTYMGTWSELTEVDAKIKVFA